MRLRRAFLAVGLLTGLSRAPAEAQQYGQWSWDGLVGLNGFHLRNEVASQDAGSYNTVEGHFTLGLNGYLLHPSVAAFRLQGDLALVRFAGGSGRNGWNLGGRGDLRLFPRGAVPITLFASKWDYRYATDTSPVPLASLADTATTWGGTFRTASGPLRGFLGGWSANRVTFVGDDRVQKDDLGFLDFSGSSGPILHHYRFERRLTEWTQVQYRNEDLHLSVDEHGSLGKGWRLDVVGLGIRRDSSYGTTAEASTDAASVRATLTHDDRRGNQLALGYTFGWTQGFNGPAASHDGELRYLWLVAPWLQIGPLVGYSYQRVAPVTFETPRAGGSVFVNVHGDHLALLVSGSAAYGQLTATTDDGLEGKNPYTRYAASTTVSFGDERSVAADVDVGWSHDYGRVAGDPIFELPDLGVSLLAPGILDSQRARLTLRHRNGLHGLTAWVEARRDEIDPIADAPISRDETFTGSLQIDLGRLTLSGNAGRTVYEREDRQELRYATGLLTWRPISPLVMTALYRAELRQLVLGPDLDARRAEIVAEFHVGLFRLRAQAFEAREELAAGGMRVNRGLVWRIERSFGGWLPIVSAPQRRGTIR